MSRSYIKPQSTEVVPSLTRKEYFAGQALAGLLHSMAHGERKREVHKMASIADCTLQQYLAREAIDMADALIEMIGDNK